MVLSGYWPMKQKPQRNGWGFWEVTSNRLAWATTQKCRQTD